MFILWWLSGGMCVSKGLLIIDHHDVTHRGCMKIIHHRSTVLVLPRAPFHTLKPHYCMLILSRFFLLPSELPLLPLKRPCRFCFPLSPTFFRQPFHCRFSLATAFALTVPPGCFFPFTSRSRVRRFACACIIDKYTRICLTVSQHQVNPARLCLQQQCCIDKIPD